MVLGVPRSILILVSRSVFCSGYCLCSPQKHIDLKNRQIVAHVCLAPGATIQRSDVRGVGRVFPGCFAGWLGLVRVD